MGVPVTISINVTDGNAAEAVQQVVTQLNAIGPAGEAAGAQASAGLDRVIATTMSAREEARLMNEELHLGMSRAMLGVVADTNLLSGAIHAIGPALIAIGAVDILSKMGESAYNLYEKYIDIDGAQKQLLKTMEEGRDKDFIDVHSLETARLRIDQATSAMIAFRGAAEGMHSGGIGDILSGNIGLGAAELLGAGKLSGMSAKAAGQTQELSPREQSLAHQQRMADIEAEHAGDSELKGQGKITAELEKQLELDKEKQKYTAIDEKQRGNPGASDAGKGLQNDEDTSARKKAIAEEIALRRQETSQIIQMQNEATNAGLEGNALRAAQEQEAIDAVTRKFLEGETDKRTASAETAAIQQRYMAEAAKIQQQLDEQTAHMADEAEQAGLKGLVLMESQLKTRLDSVNAAERKAVGPGGTETDAQYADFNSQRASAEQTADQRMTESREQFTERVKTLEDSANNFMLSGYAKIESETVAHLDKLSKAYEEEYGNDRSQWAGYQQAQTAIEADADRERQQLHQKTMQQIQKEEEQTARLLLPEWQQAQLAVEDAYKQRLAVITQDVKQHVMTEQESAAAVTAAWQQEQADMVKAMDQTRDKLAGSLSSLFSNPTQFFEKRAMDTAFQMMSNEMMAYFKQSGAGSNLLEYIFGMGPEMSTSTNPMTAIQSALGMGGATHTGGSLATGATLGNAGTTLLSAGQLQITAAQALQSAASSLQMGGSGTGLGGGGLSFGGSTSALGNGFGGGGGGTGGGGDFGSPNMVAGGAAGDYSTGIGDGSTDFGSATGPAASAGITGNQYLGAAGAAVTGAAGIYSAYTNSNPVAGGISGAMAGAEIGSLAGPVGTVIGAALGGITGILAGVFGDQGRGAAESLDVNTVQPGIAKDMQDYNAGRSGYTQIYNNLSQMLISAQNSTQQEGSGARNYFNSNIQPEINAALALIQKEERGGRSAVTMSAAQYHDGGFTGNFGDLDMGGGEGFAKLLANEFVVTPGAAAAHAPMLQAMNAGANFSYSNNVQPRMPAGSSSGGGASITIQAIDSKSVATWAKGGGGRALVAAMNQAQRQYSGVGRG